MFWCPAQTGRPFYYKTASLYYLSPEAIVLRNR